jgi:hypothetical protein
MDFSIVQGSTDRIIRKDIELKLCVIDAKEVMPGNKLNYRLTD